ncbi:protein slit-like isoform X3 [Mytilus californianus]|uniref:protein slit-like isoform X1 n=1 Tax=Mytilus californianus TaxID=6549 RepID=UPI00224613B9|nr:protein slit-like isoform X1 [Mytilus californianus]XP_052061564.1 protein slit-like isoform X2 [Mytilus californianus]XP_052061565.1 protein slit-like isoform X3 [Mytilus californianus]
MLYPVIIILTVSTIHESYASWCSNQTQAMCSCFQTSISCSEQPSLTQIPSNIPTDTTYLDLTRNGITSVDATSLSGLTLLTRLALEGNQLSSIEPGVFNGLFSLIILGLERNQLSSIERGVFNGLLSLESIHLFENKIISIEANAFYGLTSLMYLSLHTNHISNIEPEMFKGLVSLKSLDLYGNNLTTVSANLFDSTTNLEELELRGNLLMCCTMIGLIEWARNQTRLDSFTGRCSDFNQTNDINSFNSTNCPVDGEWGSWSTTPCSVTCGNGFIFRYRSCDSPFPSKDGQLCVGTKFDFLNCSLGNCPEPCKESDKTSEWKKAKEGKWRRNRRRQLH